MTVVSHGKPRFLGKLISSVDFGGMLPAARERSHQATVSDARAAGVPRDTSSASVTFFMKGCGLRAKRSQPGPERLNSRAGSAKWRTRPPRR